MTVKRRNGSRIGEKMKTVSIIIIGDEILSAKFQDENTSFLLNQCSMLGIKVNTVRIIPDLLSVIQSVVYEESTKSDYVFTTGGVGPTHDDLTMKGIAMAFDVLLVRNPVLEERIRSKMGDKCTEAALGMADIPDTAKLLDSAKGFFPQIVMNNVYIFPGIPYLLKKKFNAITHQFEGSIVEVRRLYLNTRESQIASELSHIQDAFPSLNIGSYPRYNEAPVTLIFTIQGLDIKQVDDCEAQLRQSFSDYLLDAPSKSDI
jgi:molybdopterin-biosynthesis enzyme MoeA-like protein